MKTKRPLKFKLRLIASLFVMSCLATGCSKDGGFVGQKPLIYCDPSKPVVFTDFTPKEGVVRTAVYIDGSNFGTDVSKIEVTIGGVKAPVIGSSGDRIYITVPRKTQNGEIKVTIKDNGSFVKEHLFEEQFNLNTTLQVGTIIGKVDPQTGASSIIDGTFEDAEFQDPWWLEFDRDSEGNKVLYCIDVEGMTALRRINLAERTVSTVFTKGQAGVKNVKSMTFESSTRDTLFFVDDNGKGNWNDRHQLPNLFYSLRNENFRKVYPFLYAQCSYSAVSMNDGSIFYNTWENSRVYKARQIFDEQAQMWDGEPLFSAKANSSDHVFMIKHPDELYVYLTGHHGIYRCMYDKEKKTLVSSILHAGDLNGGSGYNDSPGANARFNRPRQGVFVKNQQYVLEGKEDVYDFYVCDTGNNAIRKVTPNGEVSTYAGRGSVGVDGQVWGWIDGEAREVARFREPCGICYDEEEQTFYVADKANKRIRTISIE